MIPFLFKVIVIPFFVALVSLLVTNFIGGRRPHLKNVRAWAYGTNVLFVSQVFFIFAIIILTVLSMGYIAFGMSVIVLMNLVAAVFSFVLGYFVQKTSIVAKNISIQPSGVWTKVCLVVSVLVSVVSFYVFGATAIISGLLYSLAVTTGSPLLADMLGDQISESEKTYVDIQHAIQTGDVSICDNMSGVSSDDVILKNACYMKVDPLYVETQENCDLYPNFINSPGAKFDVAEDIQARCVIDNLAISFYQSRALDCAVLLERFADNDKIDSVREKCIALEVLQDVVLTGDSTSCDGYSDQDDQDVKVVCNAEFGVMTMDSQDKISLIQEIFDIRGKTPVYSGTLKP